MEPAHFIEMPGIVLTTRGTTWESSIHGNGYPKIATWRGLIPQVADGGAKKWKRKGAWRGAYFPKFSVTVAYHRAVLIAKYKKKEVAMALNVCCLLSLYFCVIDWSVIGYSLARWEPKQSAVSAQDGVKGVYRVDVDIVSDEWSRINTGHWWGYDKFPKETPLVFYRHGRPINPPLGLLDGFQVVLENMVRHIQKEVPKNTLKFWCLQSPRHFYGGEWNQNGSCLFDRPLEEDQLGLWFNPSNNGVNKEARTLDHLIKEAVQGTYIQVLDLTHLSEFRADAHPAIWLGQKEAVSIWGQDCTHWCLPSVPDTWVDILVQLIHNSFETG
ncbi:Protein trichome birefringence-like 12 [Hibiscus syriacus]|uniref:Protein trichome birefringence-like 12 n=1 Tax=Hibiscus syriacus TaxID=106335 RepID=A0A6A2ZGK6_HIBSY|nr:Protein trichome birefringence-like 12 [Hibiscus syriacus]